MMILLDRQLFRTFLRAYAICLSSMLVLYMVVDLFTNIDDFAQEGSSLPQILRHIFIYYRCDLFRIFDRLSEAIVLLAAMFTVAWMQRSNELLPLLSTGVPTQRVLRPVLLGAVFMLGIGVLNTELYIPEISDQLLARRDDPVGEKQIDVQGAFDSNGIHIEGAVAFRKERTIKFFYVTTPESSSSSMLHISATDAFHIPPDPSMKYSGGWLLIGCTPAEPETGTHPSIMMIDPGKFFLKTEVTFDMVTRQKNWFVYASTTDLRRLLDKPDSRRLGSVAVMYHMRLTRPLVGFLLVVMGLGIIMRDQTRHVFISTGLCLVMCAVFYGVVFGSKFLGDNDYIAPALAAWLPVMVFSPPALVLYDSMHT